MGLSSNHISYGLSMTEVGIISGVVWGLPFLQFIWQQELVFYDELCKQDCIDDCRNSNSTQNCDLLCDKEYLKSQQEGNRSNRK